MLKELGFNFTTLKSSDHAGFSFIDFPKHVENQIVRVECEVYGTVIYKKHKLWSFHHACDPLYRPMVHFYLDELSAASQSLQFVKPAIKTPIIDLTIEDDLDLSILPLKMCQ
jgi:hypothetical protein